MKITVTTFVLDPGPITIEDIRKAFNVCRVCGKTFSSKSNRNEHEEECFNN